MVSEHIADFVDQILFEPGEFHLLPLALLLQALHEGDEAAPVLLVDGQDLLPEDVHDVTTGLDQPDHLVDSVTGHHVGAHGAHDGQSVVGA